MICYDVYMSFHNDGQFPVSHEALANILSAYGVTTFSYSIATNGIENTTCLIETSKQKYALRIYRQAKKPLPAIEREIAFMQILRSQGSPIPRVYSNQAEEMVAQVDWDGRSWEVLLMECMPGEHPAAYSTLLLNQMARAQAQMHILGGEFAKSHNSPPSLTELAEGEFAWRINTSQIKDKRLLNYLNRIVNYRVPLDSSLPCGYSHFDLDIGNILVDAHGSLAAILDFDDLQYAPLVVCLGYSLWSILYESKRKDLVEQYLTAYQKIRQFTEKEREYLPKIMLFRHYVITALKILNGHTTDEDVLFYENIEQQLGQLSQEISIMSHGT